MRLIDADSLLERMKRTSRYFNIKFDIEEVPTIEAEPVRHGRWELKRHKLLGNSYDYVCSACGCDYALAEYNYCPHCGAKMDGDTE